MVNTLLLFDGVCNLCNGLVRFILRHERNPVIRFAALQSIPADSSLIKLIPNTIGPSTIVFMENNKTYVKSEAAFKIAAHLRRPWSWLSWFRFLPRPVSDFVYDLIAKYRYRLFGKSESCMVPDAKYLPRFLF